MQHSIGFLAAALLAFSFPAAIAVDISMPSAPDTLVLRSGRTVNGLIVNRTPQSVTLQTRYGETTYRAEDIIRILDESSDDKYFTDVTRRGSLPPWRVLVNDLRQNDLIRTFEQIPATVIDNGDFRNVPYMSFRINNDLELNIFGDPEDPAGVEIGIYGKRQRNADLRRLCREFVASYLTTRDEIAALYALDQRGDRRTAGEMVVEITPPDAPDAYGAWWLSIFSPEEIERARLSDAGYAALTTPMNEVMDANGMILDRAWSQGDLDDAVRLGRDAGSSDRMFVRGFYRDDSGNFRLIE